MPSGLDVDEVEASLAAYYDAEGDGRMHRPIDPRRLAARETFIRSLPRSATVLEIGSGPGRDAIAILDAGRRYVGVDLSIEHARRCRATGAAVGVASARRLPFGAGSFHAVWTMSTLMHVPNTAIDSALSELFRVLVPGGVAAIGVWGGPDIEEASADDQHPERPPRLFSRRSSERWRSMLAASGVVEEFETWGDEAGDSFFYQWALVRKSQRSATGTSGERR